VETLPDVGVLVLLLSAILLTRTPVAYMILALTVALFALGAQLPLATLETRMAGAVNIWAYTAVPLFVLTGFLMQEARLTDRLTDAINSVIGWVPGGLGHVAVGTNMLMAGMSGSDLADAAATGAVLIPSMKRSGFPAGYAATLIAAAATIGPLIPPSVPFILYGTIMRQPIGKLFLAGLVPGVIVGIALAIMVFFDAKARGYGSLTAFNLRRALGLLWRATPLFALPIVVIGGLVKGYFTPTEASVIAVVGVLILGALYRSLSLRAVLKSFIRAATLSGQILLLIAVAGPFGFFLALKNAEAPLIGLIASIPAQPAIVMLAMVFMLLLLGCIADTTLILLLVVPLLAPIATNLGFDPIQFGVIVVLTLMIGLMMPPYGLAMYVTTSIAEIDIATFARFVPRPLAVLVAVLMLIVFVPSVSLWLPDHVG
jgi:C4-dicarboxylate transporter DctM subunit